MTRIYGYAETLYDLMPRAASTNFCEGTPVPGFVEGQVLPNPYVDDDGNHSPIGLVLCYLEVDTEYLEDMSTRHVRDCEDADDPDEPCVVCAEAADNSIYTTWVRGWLAEEYDISFTEQALDILWEAETSGLTLDEFLEQAQLRNEL